jgi:hypothetical protein
MEGVPIGECEVVDNVSVGVFVTAGCVTVEC